MDKPILKEEVFLSYYGDDFTGSADVMESLALNGIPTVLFLDAPAPQEVSRFRLKVGIGAEAGREKLKAFGVAGMARSLSPAKMDEQLPAIFEKLSKVPTDFFQYKVCSTFDSSPQIGNIGHATEIALKYFHSDWIPLIIGAPFLNRFVLFGNLFARVGDITFRLDRHPTMSKHPVTPMDESDLGRHLQKQTKRKVLLIDVFGLEGNYGPVQDYFKKIIKEKGNFILFDTLSPHHLSIIGKLLIENLNQKTQFLVGASGMDYALAFYLQAKGKIVKPKMVSHPGKVNKMIVAAGSCSYTTASQIEYMKSIGHESIWLDSLKLIDPEKRKEEVESAIFKSMRAIENGKVPLLYTSKGPDDPMIDRTKQKLRDQGSDDSLVGEVLAGAQGHILKELIEKAGKMRVAVAGGDTSGYVCRAMGIYALETLCPIAPGAPLCIAHSKDKRFDGLEIALKGGQNGNEKYFESILNGELLS